MKRFLSLIALMLVCLCACGNVNKKNDKFTVVVSIAPEYDWVRNIIGDDKDVDLVLLTKNGADMHSYEPTADDIITISTCDVFIYVGGESDAWASDALKNRTNSKMEVIKLLDILGNEALQEEHKEGMQGEEEEDPETDEHVWLSLKNAEIMCKEIADRLAKARPEKADLYSANCAEYCKKLEALDASYTEAISNSKTNTIIIADRFPFRYLVHDYSLDYYAAFSGCSAETEASFETLTFLADKLDECGGRYIFTIDNSDDRLAKTIIQSSNSKSAEIIKLDSMQNVSLEMLEKGSNYLKSMENNLEALRKALN